MTITRGSGVTFGFGNGGGITSMQIIEVNTAYTVSVADDVILATGTFTVSLPPLSTVVKPVTIKSVLGGGTITINPDGAELIEGGLTFLLTPGTAITTTKSASGWEIL